jgi:hypothetical protein
MDQSREWPDLDYVEDSFVGPFHWQTVTNFEGYLHRCGWTSIVFDESYLKYLAQYHGGCPRKRYFDTSFGTDHVLERFHHFDDALPHESPLRVYNVQRAWSDASDRLGLYLMPCAELFAGDMLCFDHSQPGRPKVVVWFHEQSTEDAPYTEFVADNFDEFLKLLHA